VVAELEALSGGGGSFTSLLRHLVAWRQQENLKPEKDQLQRFSFGRKELPPEWFNLLERELQGTEWRLGLSLAIGRPYASLTDIAQLLNDQFDSALLDALETGLLWIDRSGFPPLPDPEASLPWLPPDFLAGLLLNQWTFHPSAPIKGDRIRWRELLLAQRPEDAMEVAMHRLRVAEVVSWQWPVITTSDPTRLLRAVQVPVNPTTLYRAKAGG
jgi:hypothetical protein